MKKLNSYINDVEREIERAIYEAKDANKNAYYGKVARTLDEAKDYAYYARKHGKEIRYYADKAVEKIDKLERAYDDAIEEKVKEVNKLIRELNRLENELAYELNQLGKQEVLMELKEEYAKAGTDAYDAKKTSSLRRDLINAECANRGKQHSELNQRDYKISNYQFRDTTRELDRAESKGRYCEDDAYRAEYANDLNDASYYCDKAYDYARGAEKDLDDSKRAFKNDVRGLENNFKKIEEKKYDVARKIEANENLINNYKYKNQLMEIRVMLKEEYAKAGTKEYNSKRAAELRNKLAEAENGGKKRK